MSPIHFPSRPGNRHWLIAALILGLTVFSAVIFQRAQAQGPALQPPFKLIRAEQPSSLELHGPVALPLEAPIIISQTFDSSYIPVLDPNIRGWHHLLGHNASANTTWKRVTTGPHPDTVWSAGQNLTGADLNPATDTYTNGMEALLVYGPIDLRDYHKLVMTSTYWLDTPVTNPLADYLGAAYSIDGSTFIEVAAHSANDPTLSVTQTAFVDLSAAAGKSQVWIAFTFVSNDDDHVARGAFIKDMVLRGSPYFKIYMPLILRQPTPTPTNTPTPTPTNTPTPTPTPTATPGVVYLYNYIFGNGSSSDPQLAEWGGVYFSPNEYWAQSNNASGNPGGAIFFYQNQLDYLAAVSPDVTAPDNYEISADVKIVQGKDDARYGLIFGASLSTFGRNSGAPYFDQNRNFYKFDLQFNNPDNTTVGFVRMERYDNGVPTLIYSKTSVANLPSVGTWHKITVRRQNGTLTAYVNGILVASTYDATFSGAREFGVFFQSKSFNSTVTPLQMLIDNVQVRQWP